MIRPISSDRARDVDFKQYKENLTYKHQRALYSIIGINICNIINDKKTD